jgi:cytochrome c-type biogenesis protein CcmH/NrfF
VKNRLIAQFGPEIQASPPKHGFDLLAWLIPGAALLAGAMVAAALARRWRGRGGPPPPPPVDPGISARIDAEMARFE